MYAYIDLNEHTHSKWCENVTPLASFLPSSKKKFNNHNKESNENCPDPSCKFLKWYDQRTAIIDACVRYFICVFSLVSTEYLHIFLSNSVEAISKNIQKISFFFFFGEMKSWNKIKYHSKFIHPHTHTHLYAYTCTYKETNKREYRQTVHKNKNLRHSHTRYITL